MDVVVRIKDTYTVHEVIVLPSRRPGVLPLHYLTPLSTDPSFLGKTNNITES